MCLAHVLRFCCQHGLLMSLDLCKAGPCPILKTTSVKLPQQPFRCYNCQHRRGSSNAPKSPLRPSCTSSVDSTGSNMTRSSTSSNEPNVTKGLFKVATAPLPGVAVQPAGTIAYCHNAARPKSQSSRPFSFACSAHWGAHHYANLPSFLPHQNHECPPCQLEGFKQDGDAYAIASGKREFPHLTAEMMVRDGRIQENCLDTMTLEKYIDEKRSDQRQMWHFVTRKWAQDLKGCKVLISEEDGLGLLL